MIPFARNALGFLIVAAAAGCAVGPNYQRPKTSAPAQWASPLAGGETNLPTADAGWWKSFHDPELDSLIARAGQSNLDLRAAWSRVREARAESALVSGELGPTVDAAGSYARTRYSANGFPPFPPGIPLDADVYQAGFDATWELDLFGGIRRAREAANAEAAAAEFGRRNLFISVFGEAARNYIEARAYQRRLEVAEDNIKAQQDVLSLTRDLAEHGLGSDLDVKQAEALLATTESQVPSFETGYQDAAHHLAVLLGQQPGALLLELSNAVPVPAAPPEVPIGLPSDLMQRRPDIQQAERELAAATARIGAATADLFPKFSLTGDVGLQSISTSDWFTGGSRYWTAGPTVQWRIFDTGRIRANIHIQNEREEQALAGYEETVLAAFEDVENGLTAYAKEQVRRESLARAVEANQQALGLAQDLYRKGLADYLRVLESQRALFESQDALIASESQVSLDLIAIYKALGGGWEQEAEIAKAGNAR